jgi:multicomponent Na+:H+ antiporter subunit G
MALIADIVSWILIVAGSGFMIIGAIGLVRMPDFYSRLHPAGLTDTLGAGLLLLGLCLQAGFTIVALKLLLIIVFLFFTSPLSSHVTARAALSAGLKPWLKPDTSEESGDGSVSR